MAVTELLTMGPPHTLTQNVVYALPARAATIFVKGTGVEQSNDGTTWAAVTADANGEFVAAGTFVRSTAVGTILSLKLS